MRIGLAIPGVLKDRAHDPGKLDGMFRKGRGRVSRSMCVAGLAAHQTLSLSAKELNLDYVRKPPLWEEQVRKAFEGGLILASLHCREDWLFGWVRRCVSFRCVIVVVSSFFAIVLLGFAGDTIPYL